MKLTRKELAQRISDLRSDAVSVAQVRRNEARWGLTVARGKDLNKRVVRYEEKTALAALKTAGVI